MKSIGIDIGRFSIKIAEIDSISKSHEITHFEEIQLNQDPTKDIEIDIIEQLRKISNRYDPSQTQYILGIDQRFVSSRLLSFPFKDRYKISKTLHFELEDEVPFKLENSIFEPTVVRHIGDHADVIAVTCPMERISKLVELGNDSQIEPKIISPKGIALYNVFNKSFEGPLQFEVLTEDEQIPEAASASVYLDIGHHDTTVLIQKEGYLVACRTIQWGGRNLANAISAKYKMHYVEALKELRNKGFVLNSDEGATQDQITFSQTLKESLTDLGSRLRLILLDAKSLHQLEYTGIQMIGGVCQLKNIGLFLTQMLEVPTNRLEKLPLPENVTLTCAITNEVAMMTCLGLALEGLKKRKHPAVNLRKGEFALQSTSLIQFQKKWGYSIKIAAAIFISFLTYSILRDSLSESLSTQSYDSMKTQAKTITGLKGRKASNKNIKKYIKERKRESKNSELASKLNEINSTMDVLKKITQLTPNNKKVQLNLKRLNILNEQVEISGTVGSRRQLKSFSTALKTMSKDGQIKTISSKHDRKTGKQHFSISYRVERLSGTL